jgi:hypothetical protein
VPLSPNDVVALVDERLLPAYWQERQRLDKLDRWCRWTMDDARLPRAATPELKRLVQLAKTPWLGLVVTTTAQCMYVDGYRSPNNVNDSQPWQTWQANDMDTRQIAVHRAALEYGTAYLTVLPGKANGESRAVMRGVSPRRMMAFYARPSEDDWPTYAVQVEPQGDGFSVLLYDATSIYFLSLDSQGGHSEYVDTRDHNTGECPVVRYAHLDLEGRAVGDVEPYIPVAARINKTSLDRLLVQHFGSWKVRTIAGLSAPDDEEEANRARIRLRQQDLLVAEDPDTKFGTLDETPLDGFIRAWESDIEALAAVAQVPTHNLTGQMVNLSAEALAAARASLNQKVTEWQKALGKSHEQALRFAAGIEGDARAAADFEAHVTWQDMEIRSMSQAVDALGKASQMLGVPPQALWPRIPGVTASDVTEWQRLARSGDALGQLTGLLARQGQPSTANPPAAQPQPAQPAQANGTPRI